MDGIEDLDLRVHHRAQMEASGLQGIIRICRTFSVATIETQMNLLQQTLDDDEKRLKERMDQEILRDLANPEDVYQALQSKTQESKARDYLLSMMQHLLLIREEGPALVHYFQLIDSMVTDLVMDKKLGGAEQRLGHSVERIIAQFNEADRYQHVEDELAKSNAAVLRLRLEKESLEEEISQGGDGLVGRGSEWFVRGNDGRVVGLVRPFGDGRAKGRHATYDFGPGIGVFGGGLGG